MTIYLVRASHANQYELQNYTGLANVLNLKLITSHHPLTATNLPTLRLYSFTDFPNFPLRKQFFNRLFGGEQWLFGIEQLAKKGDILHTAETYTPYTHQAVQLRKTNKITKLICTCWETIPHNNEKFSRFRQWKKEAYQFVDLFHTPTLRAKQALIKEGVSPHKIRVIPYGVNPGFSPTTPSNRSRLKVLTVARRVKEKGLEEYTYLKRDLSATADFEWIDSTPYNLLPQIYQKADIFLFPSQISPTWEEQYGMALIEALNAKLPIVTTNSGAIPEVVGNAALISKVGDYLGLKNNLTKLIQDHKLRHLYQARSLERARKYQISRLSQELAKLYTE